LWALAAIGAVARGAGKAVAEISTRQPLLENPRTDIVIGFFVWNGLKSIKSDKRCSEVFRRINKK